MSRQPLLVLLLLLVACAPPVEPGVDGGPDQPDAGIVEAPHRVRLGTFNVRRFFDTVCATGDCTSSSYEALPTETQYEARVDQIAGAVKNMKVDVIALEEIETQACLDSLLDRLDGAMAYGVIGETGAPGSVDVAVLSKTPIVRTAGHRAGLILTRPDGSVTSFSRELLEVEVNVDGGTVVMFAAHFKSKSDDDPGRRLAEAQASRQVVLARAAASPGALVVLGGDLNDDPSSDALSALTADDALIRVAADLPEADQGTYLFNGQTQAIDHLLWAPTDAGVRVPKSTLVWKDGRGFAGSDHRALTSEWEF